MATEPATSIEEIEPMVHLIRGRRVMLDSDLARIYGVETKRLKEQFNRNRQKFPADFAFVLNRQEVAEMRSQNATASKRNFRYRPTAFTEHGTIMLATILNSKRAVEMSVFVVRAFIRMRELMAGNTQLAQRLAELENRVGGHDQSITELIEAIRQLVQPAAYPEIRPEIGFHVREEAPPYKVKRQRK